MAMAQNNGRFGHPNNVFWFEHLNDDIDEPTQWWLGIKTTIQHAGTSQASEHHVLVLFSTTTGRYKLLQPQPVTVY